MVHLRQVHILAPILLTCEFGMPETSGCLSLNIHRHTRKTYGPVGFLFHMYLQVCAQKRAHVSYPYCAHLLWEAIAKASAMRSDAYTHNLRRECVCMHACLSIHALLPSGGWHMSEREAWEQAHRDSSAFICSVQYTCIYMYPLCVCLYACRDWSSGSMRRVLHTYFCTTSVFLFTMPPLTVVVTYTLDTTLHWW